MDGPHRRPMECDKPHPAQRSGTARWARSTLERSATSNGRNPVDFAHRRTVEGFTFKVRKVPDGTSTFPELGTLWGDRASTLGHRPGSQRSRWLGPARVFHRRNVCSGEKRGRCVGPTKRGKGTKIMAIADGHGLPLAVCTESASPAEVTLVERTVEQRFVADPPERLIGDKAYDSDGLDKQMMSEFGTEVIAPHRKGRRLEHKTQDARALRRFHRRWKVERMFAWMYNFRRLVVRWEYHAENFLGFVHLGCAIILLRYL
jgi:transposase